MLRSPNLTLRSTLWPCISLVVATVTLVAACGGSPDIALPGPDATTPPLDRVTFAARANDICRATTRAIAERTEQIGTASLDTGAGGDRRQLREAVEPIARLALTRLRNLTPPPADAALVTRGLDAMQDAVDALATDPRAPLDPVGLNMPELFDYGLTGCFTKH